jgi:hypothetical protein
MVVGMEEAMSGLHLVIVVAVIFWMRRTRVFDDPDAKSSKRGTWSQFTDAFLNRTPPVETLPGDDHGGSPYGKDDRPPEDERLE